MSSRSFVPLLAGLVLPLLLFACSDSSGPPTAPSTSDAIHKIKHVVVIMQENRSFDSYFGTFPGADGIPMANGVPTVCVPDPSSAAASAPITTRLMRIVAGLTRWVTP